MKKFTSGSYKNLFRNHIHYMYKKDLVLNNLQWLIPLKPDHTIQKHPLRLKHYEPMCRVLAILNEHGYISTYFVSLNKFNTALQ